MKRVNALRRTNAAALIVGAMFAFSGSARADDVIADDLIVQGSTCVGLDCVNNETFNFSTLRLKENNTRIDFIDTSVGSFPTRDWRLEANSSASGGANYFAIKDMGDSSTGAEGGTALLTVTAGARANSIFLGANNKVGFGTAVPLMDLHMLTGNTPAVRFEQDASSGFTAQTWDIAANEANFFVRDVTGGSRLPFRIRPGAPTSSIDIAASGFVGIGTPSPAANLHVKSAANPTIELQTTGASLADWTIAVANSNGLFSVRDNVSGNAPFKIFPGAPTNSITINPSGSLQVASLPNCATGIKTNANGTMSCLGGPSPPGNSAASSGVTGVTLASHHNSSSTTASGQGSPAPAPSNVHERTVGCSDGDMAGNWSMLGSNIEAVGAGSVLWCDVQFADAGKTPIKYSVSGNCRSHAPNDATPHDYVVSGVRSITVTPSCNFSGSFKIKQGGTTMTATILEGRIEGTGDSKTHAVGVSRWQRGKTSALQTFVMQR
jgi:hypothetical protein